MNWRCDSAAVCVLEDKIICSRWRPEFAIQHNTEKILYDDEKTGCRIVRKANEKIPDGK